MTTPARLPDAVSLETVLAGLDAAPADADLIPALTAAFPGFAFGVAPVDDDYWRDTRTVIGPDDTRVGELRPWMAAELARDGGDVKAAWARLRETDLQITEWRWHERLRVGVNRAGSGELCSDHATAFDGAAPMDGITSRALVSDPETRRALQLDALSAILPMERRDRLAELLTDDDVATLKHLAPEGMGENTLRALASDLAYLEG
jgi:hypothetical protein